MFTSGRIKNFIYSFSDLYHRYKVESQKLRSVRYRINSTLRDFHDTGKFVLSITDHPGYFLSAMTIDELKRSLDIITHMHPVDVNTVNDLYYLSRDDVKEIRATGSSVTAYFKDGSKRIYKVNEGVPYKNIPPRVSYLLGYMQAEHYIKRSYSNTNNTNRYKIEKDNITTLSVIDNTQKAIVLKSPIEILTSEEYKFYSREDVIRIGYICGQMSNLKA